MESTQNGERRAKMWERSATDPNAVFVHYRTDPDNLNASCESCVFYRNEDCINNNCDDGYYVTLHKAIKLKLES